MGRLTREVSQLREFVLLVQFCILTIEQYRSLLLALCQPLNFSFDLPRGKVWGTPALDAILQYLCPSFLIVLAKCLSCLLIDFRRSWRSCLTSAAFSFSLLFLLYMSVFNYCHPRSHCHCAISHISQTHFTPHRFLFVKWRSRSLERNSEGGRGITRRGS